MTKRLTVLLTAAAFLLCAWADILYTRGGEQVSGRLLKINATGVRFQGPGGKKTYPKDAVLKVQLQRSRLFDDVETAADITDPDLLACLDAQPTREDYPTAGYVTLLDRRTFDLREPGIVVDTTRLIVKVMQQRGEDVASQNVYYFEDCDEVRVDFALTVSPDGKVLHLSDAALKAESIHPRLPQYQRLSRYRFACKEPKPGSVLDIQYTVKRRRDSVFMPFHGRELFQGGEPLLRKEVFVLVPPERRETVQWQLAGPETVGHDETETDEGLVRMHWVLSEAQQGIMPEPLMPPLAYFAPVLDVTVNPGGLDWAGLGRVYAQELAKVPPLPDGLAAQAKRIAQDAGEQGPVAALHAHVARNVRTAPVPPGHFSYIPHPASDTVARGIANELDKDFLLARMLQAAGVDCAFTLVRERDDGPLAEDVVSLRAFTRPAVRLATGEYLTAASDLLPWDALPPEMQGAAALTPDGLGRTDAPLPRDELELTEFEASLSPEGDMDLRITFTATDNAGTWMRAYKDLDKQQLENRLRQLTGYLSPGAVLRGYETTELAGLSTPPAITLTCTLPHYAMPVGENIMLFTMPGLFYDARDVGRPTRQHPLYFQRVAREAAHGVVTLPEGYRVYNVPDGIRCYSEVAAYEASQQVEAGGRRIVFRDQYDVKQVFAPASAYDGYKACKEQRARVPLERIVLVKEGFEP